MSELDAENKPRDEAAIEAAFRAKHPLITGPDLAVHARMLFGLHPQTGEVTPNMIELAKALASENPITRERGHREFREMMGPPAGHFGNRITSMRRVFAAEAARARQGGEAPSAALYMQTQTAILLCDILEAVQGNAAAVADLADELREIRLTRK